jgi:tetratricopeptide (TPR) repeat protein
VRVASVVTRSAAPAPEARGRSFLVLPFRNVTRSEQHDWLVEGSPALLSDALGRWQEVQVVPAERLYPALRRHGLEPGQVMDQALIRRVAEETEGWTAVTGDVLATGSRIRITARAYDVVTDEVVVTATETAESEDAILDTFERLAGQLLERAGLSVEGSSAGSSITSSIDAYKAYLRGLRHYHRNEVQQAREAFEEAVAIDSTLARAYVRLAESLMITPEAFLDPQSPAYRYAERAAALAAQLPERDRLLVQALTAQFRGQLGETRSALEQLVALDSNNVEALEALADLESFDPVLVATPLGERPRGSLNRAALLSKRALAVDPGRSHNYGTLLTVYTTAAGGGHGRVVGIEGEQPSLVALLQAYASPSAHNFVVLLRDSIEIMPAESLQTLPHDTVEAAETRAGEAAVAWANQWMAATPDAGWANLKVSEAHAVVGNHDLAMTYLARAESLGVEIDVLADFPGRRMQALVLAGRYDEATRLADSLWDADYFSMAGLASGGLLRQHDLSWIFTLDLLAARFDEAEELWGYLVGLALQNPQVTDTTVAQVNILCFLSCRTDATSLMLYPWMPERIRFAAADSFVAHLDSVPTGGWLEEHRATVLRNSVRNAWPEDRVAAVARWREAASGYFDDGRSELTVELLVPAINLDTTVTGRMASFGLLQRVVAAEPANLEAWYQMGKIGALTGERLDEAWAALERYVEEGPVEDGPTLAGAHWRLGMIHEHRGDVDAARAAFERALALDPEFTAARQALEQLGGGGGNDR